MSKIIRLKEQDLQKIVKNAVKMVLKEAKTVTQFNLFDEPETTVVRKPRRKKTEKEKEEERERKALEKRRAYDKKFDEYWAKVGVHQGELFPDEK